MLGIHTQPTNTHLGVQTTLCPWSSWGSESPPPLFGLLLWESVKAGRLQGKDKGKLPGMQGTQIHTKGRQNLGRPEEVDELS